MSEAKAWESLRDRRFLGLKFRRQHPIGAYVVDFYCSELGLAVEIDGGVHSDLERMARDAERQEVIEQSGTWFYRVPASDIEIGDQWLRPLERKIREAGTRAVQPQTPRRGR